MTTLMNAPMVYKPFHYPWAYEAWLQQQRIHWLPEEVPLADDVQDWTNKLTDQERNLLTQIFRFFVQSDIEVNNCYMRHYARIFDPTEVQMMLAAFSNMETVHIAAYSHLLDTVGMPEVEYEAFLNIKEMRDKYDYMRQFNTESPMGIARTLAMFGAFTEGVQLFASFAILMNFPRFNKMKGMGQIITWSVRDETLHTNSIIKLYHTFVDEFRNVADLDYALLINDIKRICLKVVDLEDAFIDKAFEMGDVEGITAKDVKDYVRYIANYRLHQLKISPLYTVDKNPLPWMDSILGLEHVNFFENRATEYSRAATEGTWDDVFGGA